MPEWPFRGRVFLQSKNRPALEDNLSLTPNPVHGARCGDYRSVDNRA